MPRRDGTERVIQLWAMLAASSPIVASFAVCQSCCETSRTSSFFAWRALSISFCWVMSRTVVSISDPSSVFAGAKHDIRCKPAAVLPIRPQFSFQGENSPLQIGREGAKKRFVVFTRLIRNEHRCGAVQNLRPRVTEHRFCLRVDSHDVSVAVGDNAPIASGARFEQANQERFTLLPEAWKRLLG